MSARANSSTGLHRELAEVKHAIRAHRYLDAPPPEASLRAFAREQYTILTSDRRSAIRIGPNHHRCSPADLQATSA